MNKSQQLIEKLQKLSESDPFKKHGYQLTKHTYLSPNDKKSILKKRKRVLDTQETMLPGKEKKMLVTVYKHEDELYGSVEHKTSDNHPKSINWYHVKKAQKTK